MAIRSFDASSNACCTICSDAVSNADVASSNNSIGGSRINARAIAIRCFWPPDNCVPPFEPTAILAAR
ncbi:hypothetical protein DERP_003164 [Dermatophagoides pteronyssinus]|uniref:Uncharacterized protein n=1 Tax=Dermatophagoides pteronyssinus TaxID=6956 RepID=A0ABQ8JIQ6_DERPT|nr:hypothetical protein DERP_003164 [Dermatophagoides pteronyssinus]